MTDDEIALLMRIARAVLRGETREAHEHLDELEALVKEDHMQSLDTWLPDEVT